MEILILFPDLGVDTEHFLSPLISLFTSKLRLGGPKMPKTYPQHIFKCKQLALLVLKLSVLRSRHRLVTRSSIDK